MKRFLAIVLLSLVTFFSPTMARADLPVDVPNVRIIPGSEINLLSSSSAIPVRIHNDFNVDVRVHLHATTSNGRISVPQTIAVNIPAQTTITAKLPVQATGVGEVDLIVWLTTFSNLKISDKTVLHINVNPGAETLILIVFSASVTLLLTLGLIRTLRKRKRALS